MSKFVHKYLGYLILTSVTGLVVIVGFIICGAELCLWGQYGSAIAGIGSFVSVYFLYVTLNRQDRSFKQERFETTFFNLLHQRRQIIDAFCLNCLEWDFTEHTPKRVVYNGGVCFQVACQEVQLIDKVLFANSSYLGMIDWDKISLYIDNELERIHNEYNDDEGIIRKMDDKYQSLLINFAYSITKDDFEEARDNGNSDDYKSKMSFTRFVKANGFFLEHYLRHFKQMLIFIDEQTANSQYYIGFLLSQMTRYEMWIVYYYSLINNDYRKLLEKLEIITYIQKLRII